MKCPKCKTIMGIEDEADIRFTSFDIGIKHELEKKKKQVEWLKQQIKELTKNQRKLPKEVFLQKLEEAFPDLKQECKLCNHKDAQLCNKHWKEKQNDEGRGR